MYRTWIAVVDATRARFFTHERLAEPEGLRDELVEREDLIDPARRSGHRRDHEATLDAEFARDILRALSLQLAALPPHRLIVCASPHMLGELRPGLAMLHNPPEIEEVSHDLTKLTPHELRVQLESYGLLRHRELAGPPRLADR